MKKTRCPLLTSLVILITFFLLLPELAGCSSSAGLPAQGGAATQIDWVNFVRFGGITYVAPLEQVGKKITGDRLGAVFAQVAFELNGNVHNPSYQIKDGDAAFLPAGTRLYIVRGYAPTFRLAASASGAFQLYEADTNPHARLGSDLLDIKGKVRSIGIISQQDGTTQLGSIQDPKEVSSLVQMIMDAPVNQNTRNQSSARYMLAFHLVDGTVTLRAYWPDTGELARGILLSATFSKLIQKAL